MSLNDTREHRILNELYVEACRALLSAYGLAVDIQENGDSPVVHNKARYVSVLGGSGEGVVLSSVLTMDQDLVAGLHPSGSADISQTDLEDWCLELNNQLVGRLKNKLLTYGCVVKLGLPVLLSGTNVSAVTAPHSEVHQYYVESADGQVTLTLTTLVAPGVELHEVEIPLDEEVVLGEGAISLF